MTGSAARGTTQVPTFIEKYNRFKTRQQKHTLKKKLEIRLLGKVSPHPGISAIHTTD
jgi:hypothetical protein